MDHSSRPRRRTKAHKNRSRPNPGNRRNHRPRKQIENRKARRPSPPIPKHQGLPRLPTPDKPVRLRSPHETSSGRRLLRRIRRPHPRLHGPQIPPRFPRQTKNAPAPHRSRKVFPQDSPHRPLQRSNQTRQFLSAGFPHPPMLAPGRGPLHHPPLRNHPRPENRKTQSGHVPPPNLRQKHNRRTLAETEGGGRALPSSSKKRRKHQVC